MKRYNSSYFNEKMKIKKEKSLNECVWVYVSLWPLWPCLSVRAEAIRESESRSIPSSLGDKIKAFRQSKRSLPCALAHNIPPFTHPVAMEMQLRPFKQFLGSAVSLGHWHAHKHTQKHTMYRHVFLISIYTCMLLLGELLPSFSLSLIHKHKDWYSFS